MKLNESRKAVSKDLMKMSSTNLFLQGLNKSVTLIFVHRDKLNSQMVPLSTGPQNVQYSFQKNNFDQKEIIEVRV